jgi:periplasmic copper chaperone A
MACPCPKQAGRCKAKPKNSLHPYDNHGKQITEDMTVITWVASTPATALLDSQYDECTVRGRAAMPVDAAWFRITQLCQEGSKTSSKLWTEIPTQGTNTSQLKYPAVLLQVIAPKAAAAADPHASHKP